MPPGRADGTALALERARSVRGLGVEVDVAVVTPVGTVDDEGIYRAHDAGVTEKSARNRYRDVPREGPSNGQEAGTFAVILENSLDGVKDSGGCFVGCSGGWASVWEWLRGNGRAHRSRRCRAAAPPV